MRKPLLVSLTALLLLGSTTTAWAQEPLHGSGAFTVAVDFDTLTLTPVGNNCRLEVEGMAEFSGTLEGEATGVTTALVRAPCSEVIANPPGTFPDVFSSDLDFSGTVDGTPVNATITYHGTAEAGGEISAVMNLSGDLRGALRVEGQLAVGGSYQGRVVFR